MYGAKNLPLKFIPTQFTDPTHQRPPSYVSLFSSWFLWEYESGKCHETLRL